MKMLIDPRPAGRSWRMKENAKREVSRGKVVAFAWSDGTMSTCKTVAGVERVCKRRAGAKIRRRKGRVVMLKHCSEFATFDPARDELLKEMLSKVPKGGTMVCCHTLTPMEKLKKLILAPLVSVVDWFSRMLKRFK